jgi:hypothetical protein
MPQTSVTQDVPVAKPGLAAEDSDWQQDISVLNEAVTNFPLEPGLFVVRGAGGDRTAKLPEVAPTAITALGVAMFSHKIREDNAVSNVENYEDEDVVPVRRRGRIYVTVENTFTAGAAVFVRHVAVSPEKLGAIRTDADGGDATAVVGARLMTSGSAGELGVLELNL